jgi:NAD(P)-dependent dehydrogenase (short-subunit alcohol dehydrogenase family)
MRLQNKVALLTGAAAAIKGELMGFGGAAAHLFVREGARVVLTDIRNELGERAAAGQVNRFRSRHPACGR